MPPLPTFSNPLDEHRLRRRRKLFFSLFLSFLVACVLLLIALGAQLSRQLPPPALEPIARCLEPAARILFRYDQNSSYLRGTIGATKADFSQLDQLVQASFQPEGVLVYYPPEDEKGEWLLVLARKRQHRLFDRLLARNLEEAGWTEALPRPAQGAPPSHPTYAVMPRLFLVSPSEERIPFAIARLDKLPVGTEKRPDPTLVLDFQGPLQFLPGGLRERTVSRVQFPTPPPGDTTCHVRVTRSGDHLVTRLTLRPSPPAASPRPTLSGEASTWEFEDPYTPDKTRVTGS